MGLKLIIAKDNDISGFVQSLTWSGDLQQASRTVKATLWHDAIPEVGERARFYYDGELLFDGVVTYVDIGRQTVSLECNDLGIYLANNYTFKEYKGTPQAIAKQVAAEFDIAVGALAARSESEKVTSTGNLSAFKVIEQAYEGEDDEKNRQYSIGVGVDRKLFVRKAGGEPVTALRYEIADSSRSRSIKSMVNRVVIIDDKAKKKGEVENADDRKKYGTFQRTYRQQKDKKDSFEAKKLLKGIELTGDLSGAGRLECVAGRAVEIIDDVTGLSGIQIIKSDSHKFTACGYEEMTLSFYYEA